MPPKKSLQNIVVQVESEALKRLEELSKEIDDKLKHISPTDEFKGKVKKEIEQIRKLTSTIEDHISNIEEMAGISRW